MLFQIIPKCLPLCDLLFFSLPHLYFHLQKRRLQSKLQENITIYHQEWIENSIQNFMKNGKIKNYFLQNCIEISSQRSKNMCIPANCHISWSYLNTGAVHRYTSFKKTLIFLQRSCKTSGLLHTTTIKTYKTSDTHFGNVE